jgi:hypothetical protein
MPPFFRGEFYMLRTHDLITKEVMNCITKQVWVDNVESLKRQCSKAATNFIFELERRFLARELLNAIEVIYLQYWLIPKAGTTFSSHLAIIQAHFGHPKAWGTAMVGGPLINPIILDE